MLMSGFWGVVSNFSVELAFWIGFISHVAFLGVLEPYIEAY